MFSTVLRGLFSLPQLLYPNYLNPKRIMHGLKSTSHLCLYKLGKAYWCKIKVKGIYRERSSRTSREVEALKTIGRWRSEKEPANPISKNIRKQGGRFAVNGSLINRKNCGKSGLQSPHN